MALPKTFKAARFEAANADLKIVDVPLVDPKPGEVLMKVLATGVCGSDHFAQDGSFGSQYPLTPGHESIGDVVAVGPGESRWKVGDRIGAGWHGGHDGTCRECQRGIFQMCQNGTVNGIFRDGGYAQYVLLRSEAVVKIPTTVDPATAAPLLCAGVTVFNALRQANILEGELVVVQGLGGLGHLAVQYAHKMGFRVAVASGSKSKESLAKELGADHYIDESKVNATEILQSLGGAACALATAPNPDIIGKLVAGLQPRGKLVVLAPVGNINVDTIALIAGGLQVSGWPSGSATDSEEAIEFAEKKNVTCIIEKFPLAKAHQALGHTLSGKARFRSVIVVE
ncbi:alcohol dehydrogenase GroES-like domain-containing protein [Bisporella sp. PMI_857]|nr:alcohol dehydrogenase GroES-like domain-containing protein [Bisporella sp. PMI_857]